MSWVMVGIAVVGGASKVIGASIGAKARREEQRKANQELARRKKQYEALDTSNPYANLQNRFAENVYEDLTVNTQQAEFMAQQQAQQQANIMQNLQGAAGASGIAGLAQTLANQGQIGSQRAAASIGQQEAQNQRLAAQGQLKVQAGEAAVDAKKAYGETLSREWEKDKIETLFGMSQQRKGAADAARQRATDATMSGIGQMAGGVTRGLGAGGVLGEDIQENIMNPQ